jgi:hypothetical protein
LIGIPLFQKIHTVRRPLLMGRGRRVMVREKATDPVPLKKLRLSAFKSHFSAGNTQEQMRDVLIGEGKAACSFRRRPFLARQVSQRDDGGLTRRESGWDAIRCFLPV